MDTGFQLSDGLGRGLVLPLVRVGGRSSLLELSSSSLSTRFRCVSVETPWPLNFSVSSLVSAMASSVASMSEFNSLIELNSEKFFCSMSWNVSTSSSTVCIPVALVILSKVA